MLAMGSACRVISLLAAVCISLPMPTESFFVMPVSRAPFLYPPGAAARYRAPHAHGRSNLNPALSLTASDGILVVGGGPR